MGLKKKLGLIFAIIDLEFFYDNPSGLNTAYAFLLSVDLLEQKSFSWIKSVILFVCVCVCVFELWITTKISSTVGSVSFIILSFTFSTLIYLELVLRLSVLIVNIPCSSVSYSFQKISKLYYQVHVLHILVLLFLHHYVMLLSDPCDLIFFFNFWNFHWSTVDLQCYVSSRHTAEWILYAYTLLNCLIFSLLPVWSWCPSSLSGVPIPSYIF